MTNTPALLQPFLATLSRFAMRAFSWNQMLAPTIGRPSISRGGLGSQLPYRSASPPRGKVHVARQTRQHGGCNFPAVFGPESTVGAISPVSLVVRIFYLPSGRIAASCVGDRRGVVSVCNPGKISAPLPPTNDLDAERALLAVARFTRAWIETTERTLIATRVLAARGFLTWG